MLVKNEKLDVEVNAAARFVDNKGTHFLFLWNPARLIPDRAARRGKNHSDDHVADFTFGMSADNKNDT